MDRDMSMYIALCAPYMEADLITDKICAHLPEETIRVDEYYKIADLLALPEQTLYDAVWVALPGALGLEAVLAMRREKPFIPLVWMSEDGEFGMNSLNLDVAMFLMPDSPTEDFRIAVQNTRRFKEVRRNLW